MEKEQIKTRQAGNGSQKGVTLLLAILLLSSILAVSFSVATILFVEVRSSGDLMRTEDSLAAVEAAGEEIVFTSKRQVPECPTRNPYCYAGINGYYTSAFGRNVILPPQQRIENDPVLVEKVLASSNTFANTKSRYYFINPLDQTGGSGYGKVKVTVLPNGNTGNLKVYLCQFDPNFSGDYETPGVACTDPSGINSYWLEDDFPLSMGGFSSYEWDLDGNQQQELVLINESGNDMYARVETYGPENPPGSGNYFPKGLPYFGKKVYDIAATDGIVNRKLRLEIPLSGSDNAGTDPCNVGLVGINQMTGCLYLGTGMDLVYSSVPAGPVVSDTDSAVPLPYADISGGINGVPDHFSIQWRGSFNFTGGSYVFLAGSDDGSRVYVDGALVVDNWFNQSYTVRSSGLVDLSPGWHQVVYEYYQGSDRAQYSLTWHKGGCDPNLEGNNLLVGCVYQGTSFGMLDSQAPTGASATGNADNFEALPLTDVSSPTGINGLSDHFSIRWKGKFDFSGGTYIFHAGSDDGSRIYLDGSMIVDNWVLQTYTVKDSAPIPVSAGQHSITVEYNQNANTGQYRVWWVKQ